LALTGCYQNKVTLWDVGAGLPKHEFNHLSAHELLFLPDRTTIITAGGGREATFWDIVAGKEINTYGLGSGEPALSADGNRILIEASTGIPTLFDVKSGKELQRTSVMAGIRSLAISTDGTLFSATDANNEVWLWGTGLDKPIVKFSGASPFRIVNRAAIAANGWRFGNQPSFPGHVYLPQFIHGQCMGYRDWPKCITPKFAK
jgi:WD40 repeat protein